MSDSARAPPGKYCRGGREGMRERGKHMPQLTRYSILVYTYIIALIYRHTHTLYIITQERGTANPTCKKSTVVSLCLLFFYFLGLS